MATKPLFVDTRALERLSRSAPRGIDRFVGGRFGLDRLTAATAAEPAAMWELQDARAERRDADRADELRRVREQT